MIPVLNQKSVFPKPDIIAYPLSRFVIYPATPTLTEFQHPKVCDQNSLIRCGGKGHKNYRQQQYSYTYDRLYSPDSNSSSTTSSVWSLSTVKSTPSSSSSSSRTTRRSSSRRSRRTTSPTVRHAHHMTVTQHKSHSFGMSDCDCKVQKRDRRRHLTTTKSVEDRNVVKCAITESQIVEMGCSTINNELPQSNTEMALHLQQHDILSRKSHRRPSHCRCTTDAVLLAHSNRSLHILLIQKCQTTVAMMPLEASTSSLGKYSNIAKCSSSTVITYKLPGGHFIDDYSTDADDPNYCSCNDDWKWYATAVENIVGTQSLRVGSLAMSSLPSGPCSIDQPVLLGKWYRTQDKKSQEELYGNDKTYHNWYYPYKPTHISKHPFERKRVYAVPDAAKIFESQFLLRTPLTKSLTVKNPATGTIVTKTTSYRCKFIPLARLHENSRTYGPILSSLPVVLASLNIICVP
ncbi:uncharacterized protein LOC126836653 isoform X2 [Adelges cooleyi]|uniref:uncharacterized protein LOC126836653 isoform X2 n=1 Tax=Adelges cooleyi TaxID=133065 RepID=UPI00217FDD79|nr:uncharacterized protein LOC126836653 isoform X2 [Adelges cooleyi]